MEQQSILVVLAHPDDESLIAGTLIEHIQAGAQVTYVCLTLGEMGRNMGMPPFANRVTLPHIRKQELAEACQIIGIQDVRHWGMHDKMIEFEDHSRWAQKLIELIMELQPARIYTFYPGNSIHPDHDACGEIVVQAVKQLPSDSRPDVLCVALTKHGKTKLEAPDVVNDVELYVDQKVLAIRAHHSQFQLMLGDYGPEKRERYKRERFWRCPL